MVLGVGRFISLAERMNRMGRRVTKETAEEMLQNVTGRDRLQDLQKQLESLEEKRRKIVARMQRLQREVEQNMGHLGANATNDISHIVNTLTLDKGRLDSINRDIQEIRQHINQLQL